MWCNNKYPNLHGLTNILFTTHVTCPMRIRKELGAYCHHSGTLAEGGSILTCASRLTLADGENSGGTRISNKCSCLEVTPITSHHNSLVKASHMTPCHHRAPVSICSICSPNGESSPAGPPSLSIHPHHSPESHLPLGTSKSLSKDSTMPN